ncbi:MAG: hypothetical protein Q9202_006099 [Teloschistes flavicans]
MADTLFDDDDDDDFWGEELDDLAEHTVQSPCLVNYDPGIELDDGWTDWEYYSDDFWDDETPKPKRQKVLNDGIEHGQATGRKRRRMKAGERIPELSLGETATLDEEKLAAIEQPVVWKIRGNSPKPPTVKAGKGEKVSILKDWKARFKPQPSRSKGKATSKSVSQPAMAVGIDQQLEDDDEGYDDDPIYYEEGEDCETLRLPDGSILPHDVRSMLRDQLLTLSPLDGPDPEDQIEDHIPVLPRKLSISPDPAPEPISPQILPSPERLKGEDQAPNNVKAPQPPYQALDAATLQNGSKDHMHTETLHPPRKRKPSASPEPQPEPVLGNGLPERKRAKHSISPNKALPHAKIGNNSTPPPTAKRGLRGPDTTKLAAEELNGEPGGERNTEEKEPKKSIRRKRKTRSTTEEPANDPAPKRLKSKVSGHDFASASAQEGIEATEKDKAPLPTKARNPAKEQKERSKPKAAVLERRSTRRR